MNARVFPSGYVRQAKVAEQNLWRLSAASLRWAQRAIRRIDWELRSGALWPVEGAVERRLARLHHLGTTLEHPPQWQVRTERDSHTRQQ